MQILYSATAFKSHIIFTGGRFQLSVRGGGGLKVVLKLNSLPIFYAMTTLTLAATPSEQEEIVMSVFHKLHGEGAVL